MSRHRLAHGLVLCLLVVLLGLAAYRFGAVELMAREWLRFGAILALGILLWSESFSKLFTRATTPLVLCALALFLWAGLQIAPLPRGILRGISPKVVAIYELAVVPGGGAAFKGALLDRMRAEGGEVGEGSVAPGPPDRGDPLVGRTLSVYPFATRRAALAWLGPLLFFLASARVAADQVTRYRLLWGVGILGGLVGLAGVLQKLGWDGSPLWTSQRFGDFDPVLPFINRNHFAGFVEMTTLTALGLLLALVSRSTGRLDRQGIRAALTDRAWSFPRLLVLVILVILGVGGLVACGSRGGALAFLFGFALLWLGRILRGRAFWAVVGVALLGIALGTVGLVVPSTQSVEAGLAAGAGDASAVGRFDLWAKTLRMFLDHPIAGTGLGTYEWAFANYKREGEWAKLDYAHNDYLHYLAETGMVGALILAAALAATLGAIVFPALGKPGTRPRFTTLGAAAAIAALLAHATVDANLQIPANASVFAVLLGVLAAAANDHREAAVEGAAG